MDAKYIIIIVVVIAIVLVLAFVAANLVGNGSGATPVSLDEEVQRIRDRGEPVTGEELNAWYVTPVNGTNAADIYTQAFTVYVAPTEGLGANLPLTGEADWGSREAPISSAMLGAIQAHCQNNAQTLALLYEGAGRSECRYPIDMGAWPDTELPHLARLRSCVRLLCEQAVVCAASADTAGAVDALCTAQTLGESLVAEPALLSQLAREAFGSIVFITTNRVVSVAPFTDHDLSRLAASLKVDEDSAGLRRGMIGERVSVLSFDSWLGSGVGQALSTMPANDSEISQLVLDVLGIGYSLEQDLGFAMRIFAELIPAFGQPLAEAADTVKELQDRVDEAPDQQHIYTKMFLPDLVRVHEVRLRTVAKCRTASAGLAVLRYARANGDAPSSLDDLVPVYLTSVPADPYDGQPLRYRREAGGFVVYSISMNRRDDGGGENADFMQAWKEGDLTFAVSL